MCDNDLDTILSYLSSKINKIFCDREFVGCVKEDFDIILRNTDNHCVIFPKLKPIFLKVLRHQAVIFDLTVFCVGNGPNQLAVVCKKEILNEEADECPPEGNKQESKTMDGEENSDKTLSKRTDRVNRPTQPFYVPPAQRSTTKKKTHHENKTTSKTLTKFKSKHKVTEKLIEKKEEAVESNMLLTKTLDKDIIQEELVTLHNPSTEFVNNTSQLPNSSEQEECGVCLDTAQLPNIEQEEESCLDTAQLPNIGQEKECGACLDTPQLSNIGQEEESGACLDVAQLPYTREQEGSVENVIQLPGSREKEEEEKGAYLDVAQLPYSREEKNLDVIELSNSEIQESGDCINVTERLCNLSLFNSCDLNESSQEEKLNLSNESVQNKISCSEDSSSTSLDNISLVISEIKANVEPSIQLQKPQELPPESAEKNQNNPDGNDEKSNKINDGSTLPALILEICTKNPKLQVVLENLRMQHSDKITTLPCIEDDKIFKYLETILMEENNYETESSNYEDILIQKLLTYFDAECGGNCGEKKSDPDLYGSCSLSNDDGNSNMDNSLHIIPPPTQSDFPDESKEPLYIDYNSDISKKKTRDCDDMDNENEEMQRVLENINRKSRSVIKHNIRNVNTLRIDENEHVPQHNANVYDNNKKCTINSPESNCNKEDRENLSNWEDMFDESGDLQPEYIGKIVKRIGCDVKIVKASHDYSAYENTKYQDLEHVIELYDFPSTLKTQDLIQLYRGAYQDAMYVKWCDDTHALLVLSSPAQAQRALQITHEVIKARPLSQASTVAALAASSADLKPAMKRPQTNMQTARRMITTHLGTKQPLSKEEVEQERRALRDAREQRRQERQNEKDAWEGRPRSSKTHPLP